MIVLIAIIIIIINTIIIKINNNDNNKLIRKSISYTDYTPCLRDGKRAYPKKITSEFPRHFLNSLPLKTKQSLTCQR